MRHPVGGRYPGTSGRGRNGRGGGGGGGRGGGDNRGPARPFFANDAPKAFTKLVRDPSASVRNAYDARRFVADMAKFDRKEDLLAQLTDSRHCGLQRIREVLAYIDTLHDVNELLVGMLDSVMAEETCRPVYRTVRNKVLWSVYLVPGLLDTLVERDYVPQLSSASAAKLAAFLLDVAKASMEARESDAVRALAKALRVRGDDNADADADARDVRALCSLILADLERPDPGAAGAGAAVRSDAPRPAAVAAWVTDHVPPGGRHDNDHFNYRNIVLVPTAEELQSEARPYLPLASGDNAFLRQDDPATHLLDRNFRLLRHDAVCAMKETIQEQQRPWYNAKIVDIDHDSMKFTGTVSFVIQCDHRYKDRRDLSYTRSLMRGSVVALCDSTTGTPLRLASITVRDDKWLRSEGGPRFGVVFQSSDDFEASFLEYVNNIAILREMEALRDGDRHNNKQRIHNLSDRLITYTLIEASKSFFAYKPILKSLQSMVSVPLEDELVFMRPSAPPAYLPGQLRLPGDACFASYLCKFDETWDPAAVTSKTSLDRSQADALHHAFTSRVAAIQGPPGTGKTFIGALIARMILQNTSETIVCVCYTNHALDQFLEHLLSSGEKRMVRLGGRSKSPNLEAFQINHLTRTKVDRSVDAARRIKQIDASIYRKRDALKSELDEIVTHIGWDSPHGGIEELLKAEYPEIYRCFQVPYQTDGFTMVGAGGRDMRSDYLFNCWEEGGSFPTSLAHHFGPEIDVVWRKSHDDRLDDIGRWRREILSSRVDTIRRTMEEISESLQEKKELQQERDLCLLRGARVIGATTAGAASYSDILTSVGAGVVIVEEAGEVLESHVLTALSDKSQHLILIGDHKQLRPKVETFKLTVVSGHGYDLDCSLFERLVTNNFPSAALEVQHRMRPEISRIIRAQTYPKLRDHESVLERPNVKGVSANVVFMDHRRVEAGEDEGTSKKNHYEAEMCIELVRFFLLQGYHPKQIVVLTPYLGQLMLLLQQVKSRLQEVTAVVSDNDLRDLEDEDSENDGADLVASSEQTATTVRCSSVDNFQGEEADIVVISLVRSNEKGIIGFLKEEQRVNVLLSRARLGMFIVGNSECLTQSKAGSAVWGPIFNILSASGQVRLGLPTLCQLHPLDEPIELRTPQDFRTYRPNGGCSRPCDYRMPCGHVCPKTCHPIDRSHVDAQRLCVEPCPRFPPGCQSNHPCPKMCKENCGSCKEPVGPIDMQCGHTSQHARCFEVGSEEALSLFSSRCREQVPHTFAGCLHTVTTTCSNAKSPEPKCPSECGKAAKCGHACRNPCSNCNDDIHSCGKRCERTFFCGHGCGRPCHDPEPCLPCTRSCRVKCSHSRCGARCREPCPPCVERCEWSCIHRGPCPLVCGAPCSRLPCNQRCDRELPCGHRCPSVCGEICPPTGNCQQCGVNRAKDRVVDLIMLSRYKDHDLDEDPVLFLRCGHFFTLSTLDGHLNMREVYDIDAASNEYLSVRPLQEASVTDRPLVCPDCREPIEGIRRYGRMLNLSMIRGLERKHMMLVDGMLENLSKAPPASRSVAGVDAVLDKIRHGPMQVVFEACRGSPLVEVPRPPTKPHLRALELKAAVYMSNAEKMDDDNYQSAVETLASAIDVAMESSSFRSAALLKMLLAKFKMRHANELEEAERVQSEVAPNLDWVMAQVHFPDLVEEARGLNVQYREFISKGARRKELKEVFAAMSKIQGYDYGGSASSHWYECPNGHAYFIGECGGAMQVSRCNECGADVGGTGHHLLGTNRPATGFLSRLGGN